MVLCADKQAANNGEVIGGCQGIGVVGAQDPAVAVQGVLVQVASGLDLAQLAQADGQIVGGVQGVGVVLPQHPAAAVQGVPVQVA